MTGYAQEEVRRRTQEAGFDEHLVKPMDPDTLEVLLAHIEWVGGGDILPGRLDPLDAAA